MSKFKNLEVGKIGLVQEKEDGRLVQIGLTEDQSLALQIFLSSLSKDKPLIQLSEEYDLTLKSKYHE